LIGLGEMVSCVGLCGRRMGGGFCLGLRVELLVRRCGPSVLGRSIGMLLSH
jgi:hypothetical protein